MTKIAGIILAGGTGTRFGSKIPKQFLKLRGKTVLEHSVDKFLKLAETIVIVVHPDWLKMCEKIPGLKNKKNIVFCTGGKTRQLSVFNGLKAIDQIKTPPLRKNGKPDLVIIHDGVRPLFSSRLLKQCIEKAALKGSAVPALKVSSTLCITKNSKIIRYLDRNMVFKVQTPQVFQYKLIRKAHDLAYTAGKWDHTDDSQIFERIGRNADILEGEITNIKITSPSDLALAAQILKNHPGGK